PGTLRLGSAFVTPPGGETWGTVTAIDVRTNRQAWQNRTDQMCIGGTMTTAGGLVFAGGANGNFDALDATSGQRLGPVQTNPGVFGVAVPPGTTITWTNQGPTVHTATSDNQVWDSGDLAAGQSFSFTFDDPGVYWYFCRPHPWMRGSISIDPNAPAPQNEAV